MMWCRLILLVTVGCILLQCRIILVSSDPAVGYSIETSELTSDAAAQQSAVAKLSSSSNQELWWQLSMADWHDSAVQRYFAAGPLDAKEMEALANANATGGTSLMDTLGISLKGSTVDLVQALQNISTTVYRMNSSIPGTGRITACLSTLVFKCIGPSCSQGMVPMLIVNSTEEPGIYSYASLWLPVSRSLLVNAAPSFINHFGPPIPVPFTALLAINGRTDSDLSLLNNVREYEKLRPCPPIALASCRTLLDSAYGLVPGSVCIQVQYPTNSEYAHHSFNLLLSIYVSSLINGSSIGRRALENILDIPDMLYKVLSFEECSEKPVLAISEGTSSSIVCSNKNCVSTILSQNVSCTTDSEELSGVELLHRLEAVVAVSKSSPECTLPPTNKGEERRPLDYSDIHNHSKIFSGVSCPILSASLVCKVSYQLIADGNYIRIVNPLSNWTFTRGLNTSEFQAAPKARQLPCTIREYHISERVFNSTQSTPPFKAIQMRGIAYLISYISGHNIAFTTAKGPSTDLYTFTALVVSTAVSVMLAVAGHFTNFLLKCICRIRPFHLDCERAAGKSRKWAKVAFLVSCNLVMSIVSFLPVLSVAWNEVEREKPFHTWDLGSYDFVYGAFESHDDQLRVLYLLSATSHYTSHFITAITTVVSFTCLVVAIGTIRRCNLIFTRYRLLQKYDLAFRSSSILSHGDTIETIATLRALRAIEMTEVAYLEKKREMRLNVPIENDPPPSKVTPPPTLKMEGYKMGCKGYKMGYKSCEGFM